MPFYNAVTARSEHLILQETVLGTAGIELSVSAYALLRPEVPFSGLSLRREDEE